MDVVIQEENAGDYAAITGVNDEAFGQVSEGRLLENLRRNSRFIPELSLLARAGERVVGHILLFPIQIWNGDQVLESLALAPMSALPQFQNQGIGSPW